jgi:hypothetical protein
VMPMYSALVWALRLRLRVTRLLVAMLDTIHTLYVP